MAKIILYFISILLLNIAYEAKAKVIPTYSINSDTISELLELMDKDSYIFIKVDNVIVKPKAKMFSYKSVEGKSFIENLSKENISQNVKFVEVYNNNRKIKLLEEGWPDFIEKAKSKGAAVYGLISNPLKLKELEQKKIIELNNLNINFTQEFRNNKNFIIDKNKYDYTNFYYGILFCGKEANSLTIKKLFAKNKLFPKKIFLFEFDMNNLNNLELLFREYNVDIYGVNYLAFKNDKDMPDEEIMETQKRILLNEARWLEDEDVEKLNNENK